MKELKFAFDSIELTTYLTFCTNNAKTIKVKYDEEHHVYPRSIFGDNDKTVILDIFNHIKAHYLLVKALRSGSISSTKMVHALIMMTNDKRVESLSEDELEEYRDIYVDIRKNHIDSISGINNNFYGKKHTEKSLSKMRGKRKPYGPQTEEHINKRIEKLQGFQNGMFNKKWYYNPQTSDSKVFVVGEELTGYILGREKGRKPYYNPETLEVKRFLENNITEGWLPGYGGTQKHINNDYSTGRKHFYNPETLKTAFEYNCPEGWLPGRKPKVEHKTTKYVFYHNIETGKKIKVLANTILDSNWKSGLGPTSRSK